MKRIDTPSRAADLFGPGKHGFKDGDPVSGDPATALDAAWFNGVQEELAGTIEAAGLPLDPGDRSQLLQAIRRLNGSGTFGGIATSGFAVTPADHGKMYSVLTDTFTITLPLLATVPDGFRVTFHKGSVAGVQSVAISGSDRFEGGMTAIDLFSLGDVLDLVKHGGYWYPLVGPAQTGWPGLVRLASSDEAAAGIETLRAVTPAGALALLNAYGLAVDGSSAVNPLSATDANAAIKSGIHVTDNGTANLPSTAAAAGILLVMARNPAGNPAIGQIYLDSGSRLFSRRRNVASWGAWQEVWLGDQAAFSPGLSGYQRLPSGMIFQWGQLAFPEGGNTLYATFPVSYTSTIYGIFANFYGASSTSNYQYSISTNERSSVGFRANTGDMQGAIGQPFSWMSIGI